MIFFRSFLNLLGVLHQGRSSRQIAAGAAAGFVIGMTPAASLHNLVILVGLRFFKVNRSAAVIFWPLVASVSWTLDPWLNQWGYFLLTKTPLRPLWIWFYNTPPFPWFRFNNTLVLGSLTAGLLLSIPTYLLIKLLADTYALQIKSHVDRWHLMKSLRGFDWWKRLTELS